MSVETSAPKIDFSPARAEDYEELMAISSGLFNGTDYVPLKYHTWLKETQRRMFVARCEGKVVGFESFIVVDDGTTAIVEGLRVASEMRRRGVGGVIERFCWDVICSEYPEVKTVRFSRSENPPSIMVKTCRMVNCKAVIPVFVSADQMEATFRLLESRVTNEDRSKNLSVLGPEEILRIFESKTKEQLLPGGLIVQGWFPVAAHKSNLDLLLKRDLVWIYSHPGDSSESASSKVTTGSDGNHAYPEGFLSLGSHPFPVPIADKVYYIDIDLFGNDPSCAKVHALEQLKVGVKGLPAGSGLIFILYAEQSLQNELAQLCEGLNIFYFMREQIIFERETNYD